MPDLERQSAKGWPNQHGRSHGTIQETIRHQRSQEGRKFLPPEQSPTSKRKNRARGARGRDGVGERVGAEGGMEAKGLQGPVVSLPLSLC